MILNKLKDWKERLKDRHMLTLVVCLVIALAVIVVLGVYTYRKQKEFRLASENQYNMAFFELVDYVGNVENYLAKALISSTPEHGAETLTHVWREANLAQAYLAQLPIDNEGLTNTAKFLNQVSDYSFSLSRKNINQEALTEEDLKNLQEMHDYSVELENTLNQLSADMNAGRISWGELTKKGSVAFAQQVSNLSKDSFSSLEESFHEYAGLIYDGAFSEHLTSAEKKGLTGEDITKEEAKQKVIEFMGQDQIEDITENGESENGDIPSYDFSVKQKADTENPVTISITKKGGHILFMNYNREVIAENISTEDAIAQGKEFLANHGFPDMQETYYLKEEGILTINYAYTQNDVTMYPDLVKLKIALDNGQIMGIETSGYLNSHTERNLAQPKISKEEAKKSLNKNLEILSEGMAVIPTQWQTELFCYEFKGRIDDTDFLVYINAETGKEEDILVIVNTPNGTLTH